MIEGNRDSFYVRNTSSFGSGKLGSILSRSLLQETLGVSFNFIDYEEARFFYSEIIHSIRDKFEQIFTDSGTSAVKSVVARSIFLIR